MLSSYAKHLTMPYTIKKRGRPALKYDWGVIKALYLQGMSKKDILALPEAKGLKEPYFNKVITEGKWADEKAAAQALAKQTGTLTIQENASKSVSRHYDFMLTELEKERRIAETRSKHGDIISQKARLGILKEIDETARRTLGLDDMKPGDANANGFQFLIAVHGAPEGGETNAAMVALSFNKTPSSPILAQPQEQIAVAREIKPAFIPIRKKRPPEEEAA